VEKYKNKIGFLVILILLGLLILFEILFAEILTPQFLKLTKGTGLLDMTTFYNPEQAFEMIENYGPGGRAFYNLIQIVDFFFPIVYTLFFMSLTAYLLKLNNLIQSRWRFLVFIPLIAGLCDWLENIGIFMMLRMYPRDFGTIAQITNISCILKFGGIGISILMILLFFIQRITSIALKNAE